MVFKKNINKFISLNQFKKGRSFSLKDLFIFNNQNFISYTEEIRKNSKFYDKYRLKKNHSDLGFVESLHYFVTSIGVSELIQFDENKFIASSMKEKSIYTFEMHNNYEL